MKKIPNSNQILIFKARSNYEKDLIAEIDEKTNCWNIISHLNGNPYPMYRKERVHTLMYRLIYGEIPKGKVVRHTCDNPRCCNPEHLIIGTIQDNNNDKMERNRIPLTIDKKLAKAIAMDESDNFTELAKKYGVSIYIISNIKRNAIKSYFGNEINNLSKNKKKLIPEKVREIYINKQNKSASYYAHKFNISESTIYDIWNKRIWKKNNRFGGLKK